ncbi:axonemal dynein light intermediate polypeptide 1-like isoform X2 [Dunckerocampus dactyliophorus]|uniref:axonemal dynein light intermediate polypeptide 1-like isoform X2 n=1 Tax=Dunckerocampus dactyliophorus TaxID=161453 RepID=UPI002405C824|nr:axonemal dynein light intermediate polypeptide 1-like isoform X2 [Dunckerocampus dactyliophorus]
MFEPLETLLKYENPVLISKTTDKKPSKGGRPFKVSSHPHADSPVPPPPKAKSSAAESSRQQNEDILNLIFPPREWMEGNQLWVQQVSSAPCTRADVVNLEELLDRKLQQRRAIETGICPVRRELYTQCFERGHLLLRVRDEIQMTIAAYQTFYESSVVFGMRKALQAEQDKVDMEKRIAELEKEKQELEKELRDEKAKCDAIEKTEEEKHEVQEKKYTEQIQFLKRTNQQLKAQLEGIVTPK